MKNKFAGSAFDDFLEEQGIASEVAARAAKKAFAYQLEKKLKTKKKKKSGLRNFFKSASTVDRLFNDHIGIELETMAKAAEYVDCELNIQLVRKAS